MLVLIATIQVPTISWQETLARLALAALLGGLIGIEREFREHEAGLRTHTLVAVGAGLFTVVSAFGFHDVLAHQTTVVARLDPSRISAQIVSGIGFLGAGAIIRQGLTIRGLTTAATLWAVAAIGMAEGAGAYSAGIIATAIVLFMLWPMRIVGRLMNPSQVHVLDVELKKDQRPAMVVEAIEQLGASVVRRGRRRPVAAAPAALAARRRARARDPEPDAAQRYPRGGLAGVAA
jgi:putative Mg2+ transporter-C (MgtC) family protein